MSGRAIVVRKSARATAYQPGGHFSCLARLLMLGSLAIILLAIGVTLYIGRAISAPITEVIGVLTSIAAGKAVANIPGQHRRDEIGALSRAVAGFDRVTRDLRDREKLLEAARQHAARANATKSMFLVNKLRRGTCRESEGL